MNIEQSRWTEKKGWESATFGRLGDAAQLVFVFGSTDLLKNLLIRNHVCKVYPKARFIGCSTAGEICGTQVTDDSLAVTAIQFDQASSRSTHINIRDVKDSVHAGEQLAQSLDPNGLRHVFVLSDGLKVNGSDLVRGLTSRLPPEVTLTGGISGDGARFQETLVLCDQIVETGAIAILGLYGSGLRIGYGSMGGWDPFGPERLVTRSKGNVLYEFDGKSALALYKRYLGEHAKGLPATGLLFPLSIRTLDGERGVVRTILSIDEKEQSITFAGDIPEKAYARLMKANFNRLIDGAVGAAKTCCSVLGSTSAELALLISCVGRKMVLRQRTEEEIEGVREVLGNKTMLTGFYSYGEIAPYEPHVKCELHNQTMTITTLSEVSV